MPNAQKKNGEQAKPAENQLLYSPRDFGRLCGGKCTATVRRWEKAGLIKGIRVNRRTVLYPATELAKLVAQGQ